MGKKKTSPKLKESSKHLLTEWKFEAKHFQNKKAIAEVLVECLLEGDSESFQDVLIAYIRANSKTRLAKEAGLTRKTLYDLMNRESNDVKISTVAAILKSMKAA